MKLYTHKKTTEPVKIKFKTKSGEDVILTATKIKTKRVRVKFDKNEPSPKNSK